MDEFIREFPDRIYHVHIKDAIVTLNGVEKGGKDLGTATFAFTTDPTVIATVDDFGTTMTDYLDFLDSYLGLDRPVPPPADPNQLVLPGGGRRRSRASKTS